MSAHHLVQSFLTVFAVLYSFRWGRSWEWEKIHKDLWLPHRLVNTNRIIQPDSLTYGYMGIRFLLLGLGYTRYSRHSFSLPLLSCFLYARCRTSRSPSLSTERVFFHSFHSCVPICDTMFRMLWVINDDYEGGIMHKGIIYFVYIGDFRFLQTISGTRSLQCMSRRSVVCHSLEESMAFQFDQNKRSPYLSPPLHAHVRRLYDFKY